MFKKFINLVRKAIGWVVFIPAVSILIIGVLLSLGAFIVRGEGSAEAALYLSDIVDRLAKYALIRG